MSSVITHETVRVGAQQILWFFFHTKKRSIYWQLFQRTAEKLLHKQGKNKENLPQLKKINCYTCLKRWKNKNALSSKRESLTHKIQLTADKTFFCSYSIFGVVCRRIKSFLIFSGCTEIWYKTFQLYRTDFIQSACSGQSVLSRWETKRTKTAFKMQVII